MNKAGVFIGTSGWVYKHWKDVFYPPDMPSNEWLSYYSKFFKTAEINNSFYHLPTKSAFHNWKNRTPEDFIFSVKVSRYITHIKRLKGIKSSWDLFLKRTAPLDEKLGPFLFQFPPSFVRNPETFKRLEKLLTYLKPYRSAFEFRNESWFTEETYELLNRFSSSLVFAHSSVYRLADHLTADFVYVRMHGPKGLFNSKYSPEEIKSLSVSVRKWMEEGRDVYVYFNNDMSGFAIKNALELLDEL